MSEWVWMVGGGIMQLPMIQEIKTRGYSLFVTDGNANCPGRDQADAFEQIDTYDIRANLAYARTIHPDNHFVAVLTDAADVGPTVSALAEMLGLTACSYLAADRARDKIAMRLYLRGLPGVPQPTWTHFGTDETVTSIQRYWEYVANIYKIQAYPCVVKPSNNSASRGISVIRDSSELEQAVTDARLSNKSSSLLNDNNRILVEEYIDGPECATDWYVEDGKVYLINAAMRIFGLDQFGLEIGHVNPWPNVPNNLIMQLPLITRALGVTEGPFKVDWIWNAKTEQWTALECATRWSGGFDHTHSACHARGTNMVSFLLDYALGLKPDINGELLQPKIKGLFCAVYAPRFSPGRILSWQGLEAAQAARDVKEIIAVEQQEIKPLKSCAARPLFVIATGATSLTAWNNAFEAGSLIRPVYAP